MSYEVIVKVAGGGFTLQWQIGPYARQPPDELLQAIAAAAEAKFEEWTAAKVETAVVTSTPI